MTSMTTTSTTTTFTITTLTRSIVSLLALAVGLGLAVAQSTSEDTEPGLAGTYVTTVTHDDLQEHGYTFDIDLVGEWTVIIGDDGFVRFRYEPPEGSGWEPYVHVAEYGLDGERFTIEPAVGNTLCDVAPEPTSGEYGWTVGDDDLTFTLVEDDCMPRRIVFVSHPLQRVRR